MTRKTFYVTLKKQWPISSNCKASAVFKARKSSVLYLAERNSRIVKSLIPQTATIGLLDILQNTSDHREEFYMNAQCKTNDVIKWIQRLRALSKVARQVSEAVRETSK